MRKPDTHISEAAVEAAKTALHNAPGAVIEYFAGESAEPGQPAVSSWDGEALARLILTAAAPHMTASARRPPAKSAPYSPEIGAVLDDLGAGRKVPQRRILTFRAELDYVLAQLVGARTELAVVTEERDQFAAKLAALDVLADNWTARAQQREGIILVAVALRDLANELRAALDGTP